MLVWRIHTWEISVGDWLMVCDGLQITVVITQPNQLVEIHKRVGDYAGIQELYGLHDRCIGQIYED